MITLFEISGKGPICQRGKSNGSTDQALPKPGKLINAEPGLFA
jgi:hypothetical protein